MPIGLRVKFYTLKINRTLDCKIMFGRKSHKMMCQSEFNVLVNMLFTDNPNFPASLCGENKKEGFSGIPYMMQISKVIP